MSRTLVHISDLHFGRVDSRVSESLVEAIRGVSPDVVAASGDMTQRARPSEFQQARRFLDRLEAPIVAVPGNHDVPLHNLYRRFFHQFEQFYRHITPDVHPEFVDDEIAVVGINTARSLTWKTGRVNRAQMARVRDRLFALPAEVLRIVVTHHPFELPEGVSSLEIVGRARMGMAKLAECGADILLSGHLHATHVCDTVHRYNIYGHSALVVQAGTACSTRQRGEPNAFNCIRVDGSRAVIEHWESEGDSFRCVRSDEFRKENRLWVRAN